MENKIAVALEKSRQELLDLGLRGNTLLHFRDRGYTNSITVIDELSTEVYRILVENQKTMSFLPIPKDLENNENPELFEEVLGDKRHIDNKLQTNLNKDLLDSKLLKINTEAETYYKEQGIDILYLALGFLSWYEDKNSEIVRRAPLILVPVSLSRNTVKSSYKLEYTQVDLGTNLTLKAKLKTDFDIDLPEISEEISVNEYFKKLRRVIKKQERWKVVENEINLGFFKFGKFQMYQDLDAKGWPDEKQPSQHPIIESLFGDGFSDSSTESEDIILQNNLGQELQNLQSFHFISDADSSQTQAIVRIKNGENLVIQGPPGTGKSQTITNIIAESLSDNKKILFVSEKMVALEVVKTRLDNCHVGDAVLELHSHKSNKKTVFKELERTLQLGQPKIDNHENQIVRYEELQNKLDNYVEAIKEPILKSELNWVQAVGLLSHYKREVESSNLDGTLKIEGLENWSKSKFNKSITLINDLIVSIEKNGVLSENYFSSSKLDHFSPADKTLVENKLSNSLEAINILKNELKKLLKIIPLNNTITLSDIQKLREAIGHIKIKPDLDGIDLLSNIWNKNEIEISKLLGHGKNFENIYKEYSEFCLDEAFECDVLNLRKVYLTKGRNWWRFFSSDYKEAKDTLRGLIKTELPSYSKCVEIINNIIKYQESKKVILDNDVIGKKLFNKNWKNLNSNWTELEEIFNWIKLLYHKIKNNEISEKIPKQLSSTNIDAILKIDTDNMLSTNDVINGIESLFSILKMEEDYKNLDLNLFEHKLNGMLDNTHQIYHITGLNIIKKDLESNDLKEVAKLGDSFAHAPSLIRDVFKFNYYNALVNYAYENKNAIKFFDSVVHKKDILEFKKLDKRLELFSQENLILNHFKNLPANHAPGEMATIRREINKKKRHITIRQLLLKAGNAVQQIKPVFMMSPMSVATFLSQGALEFDLVIFDEASQVKVVDALIPILRGKQIVVVGDTMQMPPSDFFSRTFENNDDNEDIVTGDIESILSMFKAQGAKESMLKWHYRSRHDSLINVSNQEFYDGRLMVFPTSGKNKNATGLKFRHFPNSSYERGKSRTNPIEAREVAMAVINHAKSTPKLTLGVVAFSTAQRDCIILELERLRRENPNLENFFANGNNENFFVKNLENVQGDERDVIFISIGYGKSDNGKLSSSFGPINREGGEKRLNVLITRARLSMEVFCNFTADDLETKNSSPFGVRALKSFLKYAETGKLETRHETGKETDSPFEDEVIDVIRKLGYEVEPQVGSAGFFIDIAVKDPNMPGKYILAVECDGASYHSSASARDRDRLRQNVLEGMGWEFHRIWSTDWFRAPVQQTKKLKAAIEKAIKSSDSENTTEDGSVKTKTHKISRKKADSSKPSQKKYQVLTKFPGLENYNGSLDIHNYLYSNHIQNIVDFEGAIHIKEVVKRFIEPLGLSRTSKSFMKIIYSAVNYGHENNYFYFDNDFLYKDEKKTVEVRDRNDLQASLKEINHVPPEEICSAILQIVKMAYSISETEVVSESLALMGFKKATQKASTVINCQIQFLIDQNQIKKESNLIMLA